MNANTWIEAHDPLEMLELLQEPPRHYSDTHRLLHSSRLLFYTMSCLRGIDDLSGAELVQRRFFGHVTSDQLVQARHALGVRAARRSGGGYSQGRRPRSVSLDAQRARALLAALADSTWEGAVGVTRETQHLLQRSQCAWLRCLFLNPIRTINIQPAWLTSTVVELARGIEADKAHDHLPILADALQDAECDDPDLLYHCRHGGPHFPQCWAAKAILECVDPS